MRLAYCTGILRTAWVIRMTAAITATISASTRISVNSDSEPACSPWAICMMLLGTRPMMLTKMMSEMPLPIPCSVIFSPSHMTKIVPAVWVMMVERVKMKPGFGTIGSPWLAPMLVRNTL